MANSLSLLELFDILENELDVKLVYTKLSWRKSDQKVFMAQIKKANRVLGFKPLIGAGDGVSQMLHWLQENWGIL